VSFLLLGAVADSLRGDYAPLAMARVQAEGSSTGYQTTLGNQSAMQMSPVAEGFPS